MSAGDARERILHEAARLFGERGYGSTSVREVARAAGVTNPALYYHFGSKEGLYVATVQLHHDALYERIAAALSERDTFHERLRAYLQVQIDVARADRSAARLLLFANHRPQSGEPQLDLMSMHQRTQALLVALHSEGLQAGAIRPDVDVDGLAMALAGLSMLAWYAALNDLPVPEDLTDRMVSTALRGVGA